MLAVAWEKYGAPEVLTVRETDKPVPGADEILVRIHCSTVFAGDCEMRRSDILPLFWLPVRLMMGLFKPRPGKVLGQELSGRVEAVGENVTDFQPGDDILAPTDASLGAYAEYIALKADWAIARKPENVSYAEAAALCVGGLNALYFHEQANIKAGERVLLVGAGGSIGTLSLQLAKTARAHVTVVDSGNKLEKLQQLGADVCIDFKQQSLATHNEQYDVVFNIHKYSSFGDGLRLVKGGGRLLLMNMYLGQLLRAFWINRRGSKSVLVTIAPYQRQALQDLVDRVSRGELKVPIDRHYSLRDIVEAHRYVDSDSKFGNVVIDVRD